MEKRPCGWGLESGRDVEGESMSFLEEVRGEWTGGGSGVWAMSLNYLYIMKGDEQKRELAEALVRHKQLKV